MTHGRNHRRSDRVAGTGTARRAAGALALGLALAGAAAGCVGGRAGPADEPAPAAGPQRCEGASCATLRAVEDLIVARQLAEVGRRTRSALALTTAAEIVLNTERQALPAPVRAAAAGGVEGARADTAPADSLGGLDPLALLAAAARLAPADEALMQIVDALRRRARGGSKGAGGGARHWEARLPAGQKETHAVTFRAGEPALVRLVGDGTSDLDVVVFDEGGKRVASCTGPRDECYVRWTPRRAGTFRVEVLNIGAAPNRYVLVTN